MKKLFYFAMMAIVTLGMSACGDDEETLVGSQWVYEEVYSETEDGITYASTITATVEFTNATNGKMIMHGEYTVNGQPMGDVYDDVQAFTYTYDGTATAGQGTMSAVDEETGETMTMPFSVKDNELTLVDIDERSGEEMSIVFTRK